MALRDKLRERVQPFLEEGEEVRHVFLAQRGPSPYFLFLSYLVMWLWRYRVVVVTNRGILVLSAGRWTPAKPKVLLRRLRRATQLGPVSGLWSKVQLGDERVWVHKRFHKDVGAADAELGTLSGGVR